MSLLSGYIFRSFWFALCVFVFFTPARQAAANERHHFETAFIYNAEGGDFLITLHGRQTFFTAETAREQTIILHPSGLVQTGAGTSLSIRFAPSGAMIKLSENTSLIYDGINDAGMFADMALIYGRVRVLSEGTGIDGIRSIVVRCGGVVSRVTEGDIGVDYILERGTMTALPVFRLDAFGGSAEVFPHGMGAAQMLAIEEGESLLLDMSAAHLFVESGPLRNEIVEYWRFRTPAAFPPAEVIGIPDIATIDTPVALVEDVPAVSALPVFEIRPEPTAPQPVVNANRGRGLLWLGLGLMVASVAVQGVAHHMPEVFPNNDIADMVHLGAYGSFGLGALISLAGILRSSPSRAR